MTLGTYAKESWEAAKYALIEARIADEGPKAQLFLRSALWSAVSTLEAELAHAGAHFLDAGRLAKFEVAIIADRKTYFQNGTLEIANTYSGESLIDRYMFFVTTFDSTFVWTEAGWLSELKAAISTRNEITHPKKPVELSVVAIEQALAAILEAISLLYRCAYQAAYPKQRAGLKQSSKQFL